MQTADNQTGPCHSNERMDKFKKQCGGPKYTWSQRGRRRSQRTDKRRHCAS